MVEDRVNPKPEVGSEGQAVDSSVTNPSTKTHSCENALISAPNEQAFVDKQSLQEEMLEKSNENQVGGLWYVHIEVVD